MRRLAFRQSRKASKEAADLGSHALAADVGSKKQKRGACAGKGLVSFIRARVRASEMVCCV